MDRFPSEDPQDAQPSYDETWSSERPSLLTSARPRAVGCSFSMTTSATRHEVETATLQWAQDMGFVRLEPFLAFSIQHQLGMRYFGELGVQTSSRANGTDVRFTASFDFWWPGQANEIQRIVDTFAAGVSTALRNQGTEVSPFLGSGLNRRRRKSIERWRNRLYVPLIVCGEVVFVAIFFARGFELFPLLISAIGWGVGVLIASMYVRYRTIGAKVTLLAFSVVMSIGMAIVFAALAAFTNF